MKLVTFTVSLILLAVPVMGIVNGALTDIPVLLATVISPLTLLFAAALFTIRGYVLSGDKLMIRRLIWENEIKLTRLLAAYADANAMRSSWRLFGNGGLFCFAGFFANKTLGRYRVFVTNPKNAVVLKFPQRTVVVSPDDPEQFVIAVKTSVKNSITTLF